MRPEPPELALSGVRGLIDGVDDGLLALLAGRRRLVAFAARIKAMSGQARRDPDREREIRRRAHRLGRRLGLPPESSDRLMSLLIADACRQQGMADCEATGEGPSGDLDQGGPPASAGMLVAMPHRFEPPLPPATWLRLLPPPRRLAPLLRCLPPSWSARLLEAAMARALAAPLAAKALAALESRRLGIEVSDFGLRWVLALREGRLRVCAPDEPAESTVRGSATDLLLLASRREDADTLFFQRRLVLTGDTELGLTARNLLDQLPWQEVPLGLRIALHRGAGLAQAARAAHRGG